MAHDLAAAAGQLLLKLRAGEGDPETLRHDGDRLSHEFLAAELARQRPGDAILSEEGVDDLTRLSADRVWIVDPLDGTREFGEPGRTDWAVHVALWERGELTSGAVALPARGKILSTVGSWPRPEAEPSVGSTPLVGSAAQSGQSQLRLVVSRTRPPDFAPRLAGQIGAVLLPLGSAGAKAATVICGDADAYVHTGTLHEWDSAAPVAVARAAGLHASRIDGSELAYNQPEPWLPDILICPAALADTLLGAISSAINRQE